MKNFDFKKEEYLTLRKEIETHMDELGKLERNCVLVSGAIYAWLAVHGTNDSFFKLGWYIPSLFAVFGGLRSLSLAIHVKNLGLYIQQIERSELSDQQGPKGWEHYLESKPRLIRPSFEALFWIVFFAVTLLVGACVK